VYPANRAFHRQVEHPIELSPQGTAPADGRGPRSHIPAHISSSVPEFGKRPWILPPRVGRSGASVEPGSLGTVGARVNPTTAQVPGSTMITPDVPKPGLGWAWDTPLALFHVRPRFVAVLIAVCTGRAVGHASEISFVWQPKASRGNGAYRGHPFGSGSPKSSAWRLASSGERTAKLVVRCAKPRRVAFSL